MGKASQKKKERKEDGLSSQSRKILKKMIKESKPEVFVVDGKAVFYNPMKNILEGNKYSSDNGKEITKRMVEDYQRFLQQRFEEERRKQEENK